MISNNVTVTPASYQTDIILTGYNLSFSCPKGCYLSSRPQISCLDNGQWDSSIPTCVNFVEDIDATIKGLHFNILLSTHLPNKTLYKYCCFIKIILSNCNLKIIHLTIFRAVYIRDIYHIRSFCCVCCERYPLCIHR